MRQIELGSKEFYDLMKDFEGFNIARGRFDKEEKKFWKIGQYYQDGQVNQVFKIFLSGCNYGIRIGS